ncbi:LacI family transcriptional regulator [Opitutus sp. ER46]|nr:LacI family transcriptional regulator [Opitutus sp. ER46]
MTPSATMQDVAVRVGVHRSTVALALRDSPRISAATRRKVQEAARLLGYRTNPLVAALMRNRRTRRTLRHETIAFVTCHATPFGWRPPHHDRPDFFPGAVQRALELGYNLEHFWLAEPGMSPRRFRDILLARNVHGVLIGRMPPGLHELELPWDPFSVVALGLTLRSPRFHAVTENHFDTVVQALDRCVAKGYRRIGFVFTEANDSPRVGARWLGAYLQYQHSAPALEPVAVCPGTPSSEAEFGAWFRRERPDALLVTHARPVLGWLRALRVDVPREVGLVELQDNPGHGAAGVYYDPAKIGALAIETLVGLLYHNETGVPADPHEVILTGSWREGNTLPGRR